MFTNKKRSLFDRPVKDVDVMTAGKNPFLQAAQEQSARTLSGNYAVKYSTTGDDFLDQFGNIGQYRKERPYADVARDCTVLWNADPETAVKFILYTRTISRQVQLLDGTKTEKVQKGQGLKHEAIVRMIWLAIEHPDTFWNNIGLFISLGSWKDIFQMLTYDLVYNGWDQRALDWDKFANLFKIASTNKVQVELFKKYMPQIQARSKCKTVRAQARTIIAKWLADVLGLTYRTYRLTKTKGTAHKWQQVISRKDFSDLDFGSVHGRALLQLTTSKFLQNQGLVKEYENWISKQPVAKFTGYVHELAQKIVDPTSRRWAPSYKTLRLYEKMTINKQYDGLIETARRDGGIDTTFLVCRDTSGSMYSHAQGINMSAGDIAKSISIFFSDLLEGPFANSWVEFHSTVKLRTYKQNNFVDKFVGDTTSYIGDTNFIGVADFFVRALRNAGSEDGFPTGILCISDGEFNSVTDRTTNVDGFKAVLKAGGFSADFVDNFKFVMWDIRSSYYGSNRKANFETYEDHTNVFYFSGYDPSVVTFLMGGSVDSKTGEVRTPKTAEELFEAAMDQEVLNLVKV